MAVNQVIVNGEELVNLRNDSVTPQTLVEGETATNSRGEKIVGNLDPVSPEEAYLITDMEGDISNEDYVPFNDVSDPEYPKKKTLFSSIVAKIKGAIGKFYNLDSSPYDGVIPANADLNYYRKAGSNYGQTIPAVGTYYCNSENAKTLLHCPVDNAFKLKIDILGGTCCRQTITIVDDFDNRGNIYTRLFVQGVQAERWTDWEIIGFKNESFTYNKATMLVSTDDLNNLNAVGTYYWIYSESETGWNPVNIPEEDAGFMYHLYIGRDNGHPLYRQIVLNPSNNKIFQRVYDGTSWGQWERIGEGGDSKPHTYEAGNIIPANSDLNNYSTKGVYHIDSITVAETISNMPINIAGKLIVLKSADNAVRLWQMYYTYSDYLTMWIRVKDNEGTWHPWRNIDNRHTYEIGADVPSNSDLNTYTTVGVYRVAPNITAATISNLPVAGVSGKLIVSKGFASDNSDNVNKYIRQEYMINNSKDTYVRLTMDAGTTWSNWEKLAFSNDSYSIQSRGYTAQIPANANLNDYTTAGTYDCVTTAIATTLTNCPTDVAFKMMVDVENNPAIVRQTITLTHYISQKSMSWVRTKNASNTWGNWYQIGIRNEELNIDFCTAIESGDLDDYKTYGMYGWSTGNSSNILNVPELRSGMLYVIKAWGDSNYIRQVVVSRDFPDNIYTRTFYQTWSTWRQITTKDSIAPSDIGNGYAEATLNGTAITATINGFQLKAGAIVAIYCRFTVPVGATLNINNTGAKNILWDYSNSIRGEEYYIFRSCLITMMYDGTSYRILGQNMLPQIGVQDYVADTSGTIFSTTAYNKNAFQFKYNLTNEQLRWNRYRNGSWYGDRRILDTDCGILAKQDLTATALTSLDSIPNNTSGRVKLAASLSPTGGEIAFSYIMYGYGDYYTLELTRVAHNKDSAYKWFRTKNGGSWQSDWMQVYPSNFFVGTCVTAANEQIKVVTVDGSFTLVKGVSIAVKFSNTNTYNATADNKITLNVNNTGAKPIYYNTGYPTGNNGTAFGIANRVHYYIYDGTNWCWLNSGCEDNTNNRKSFYGTCATAASEQVKVVALSDTNGWELRAGTIVGVKFSNSNTYNYTADNPLYININNTGNKKVYYNTSYPTGTCIQCAGAANRVNYYMYNGTDWLWLSHGTDWNDVDPRVLGFGYATCDTAAATTAKVATLTNYALRTGGYVSVKFTYAVPANATLNINSRGAKAIYYRGSAITANTIQAGDIATFVYNGTYYILVGIDSIGMKRDGSNATSYVKLQSKVAEGDSSNAVGNYSHAEGYMSVAANDYDHAEGYNGVTGVLLRNGTMADNDRVVFAHGSSTKTNYNCITDASDSNIFSIDGRGNFFANGAQSLCRGVINGVLVASGETIELEDGACYVLYTHTRNKSTGAWRGAQAYYISATFHPAGTGTSTTAQAVPQIASLGAVGTVGVNLSKKTIAYTNSAGATRYHSAIGIGTCTTAFRARWNLIKVLGSDDDFNI